MNRPQSARTRPPPLAHANQNPTKYEEDDDDDCVLNDDDQDDQEDDYEIDLDAYEAYLADIQKKAESRPQSNARPLRPYPSESPQFYMVNATNPVTPIDLRSVSSPPTVKSEEKARGSAPRSTVRPMSARPRLHSGGEDGQSIHRTSAQVPRAPQTARPSSASSGARHRRHESTMISGGTGGGRGGGRGDSAVSARIRAVYSDVGCTSSTSSMTSSSSHTATSVLQSRLKVFQEAELQHEYSRLVDVISDLRCVVQHEQSQRLKAMARVRRLEEIVALKDKKIEAMLQSQSTRASLACHGVDPTSLSAMAQREMAQKERHHHALMQKLRHKLAQQSRILASYEDAMHTLRSSIKCTQRIELEEETQQLQIEVTRLHGVVEELQSHIDLQRRQLGDVASGEAGHHVHVSKLQEQLQRSAKEKHVLEQELLFLRATVQQLEHALGLEQKKRVYDQAMASSSSRNGGAKTQTRTSASTPLSAGRTMSSPRMDSAAASSLAEALADMKTLRGSAGDDLPASSAASPVKRQRSTATPRRMVISNGEEEEKEEEGIGPHLHASTLPTVPPLTRRMPSNEMMGEHDLVLPEVREQGGGGAQICGGRALVSVLKSPLSGEAEGTKKHVRWRTTEDEEEDSKCISEVESSGPTGDIERVRTANGIEMQGVDEVGETKEKTRLDQDLAQAERIEERMDDEDEGVAQRNELGHEETNERQEEEEADTEEGKEGEEENQEEKKEEHASHAQSQAAGVDREDDNESAANDHVYRDISSEREDQGRQDLESQSSLSRTNSSDSHNSQSTGLGSLSRSDSCDSSGSGSTQPSGSSSLSSLLAQADEATMAILAATATSAESEEPEELHYASDFSDGEE